jgi:hypothetical protein
MVNGELRFAVQVSDTTMLRNEIMLVKKMTHK